MALRPFLQIFLLTCLLNNLVFSACPDGAIEGFTEKGVAACYLYERFPAQFVTAERLCRDSDGHLASISDLFVNDFVAQGGVEAFEIMQVDNFWIGGDDLEKRGSWEWIGGAQFDYTNWADQEPVDDARSFCIALSLPEGLWYARSCYESKPYVCEVPQLVTTSGQHRNHSSRTTRYHKPTHSNTTSQPAPKCSQGWSYLPATDLCYKVVTDASDCYRPNTQEASVHSKTINDFIGKLAQKESKSKNIKVRLSLAQYHPSKKTQEGGKQVKPWLMPNSWGLRNVNARRQFFDNLRKHKTHDRSSSSEERDSWTWFDGSDVNFTNWARKEPKKFEEFTCAQLNTCLHGDCAKSSKFEWSSTDCLKSERAVCSQYPNNN